MKTVMLATCLLLMTLSFAAPAMAAPVDDDSPFSVCSAPATIRYGTWSQRIEEACVTIGDRAAQA